MGAGGLRISHRPAAVADRCGFVGGLGPRRQACVWVRRLPQPPGMTAVEFEARIVAWAQARREIAALVQIGSRAQSSGAVDQWSDWDYHLIVRNGRNFASVGWLDEIAPCWCAHRERTERAVDKVSAVFEDGHEVDLVLLAEWQMRLVCAAMRRPVWRSLHPRALSDGIRNLRLIAGPGYRVVLGGAAWERRYDSLREPWPNEEVTQENFRRLQTGFWRHAIWCYKKTARGEFRAAARWHGREIMEALYIVLAEEARLAGRTARPEARKAEQWLSAERLKQTAITPGLEARSQARALLATIEVFNAAMRSVAAQRGFALEPHAEVEQWLRTELQRMGG